MCWIGSGQGLWSGLHLQQACVPAPADGRCLCCAVGRGVGRGSLAGTVCVWQLLWRSGASCKARLAADLCGLRPGLAGGGHFSAATPSCSFVGSRLAECSRLARPLTPAHSLIPFFGTGRERGGGGGRGPGQQTHGRSAGARPPAWLLHAHMHTHTATRALSTCPACLCPAYVLVALLGACLCPAHAAPCCALLDCRRGPPMPRSSRRSASSSEEAAGGRLHCRGRASGAAKQVRAGQLRQHSAFC